MEDELMANEEIRKCFGRGWKGAEEWRNAVPTETSLRE